MSRIPALMIILGLVITRGAFADGPADNVALQVRRIPKLGIELKPEVREELEKNLADLKKQYDGIGDRGNPEVKELLPDIEICYKAVSDALKYQEFFAEGDVEKARELIKFGNDRVAALNAKHATWPSQTGLNVRGYVSKIDGSTQPYGLVVPENYSPRASGKFRLDVWFHGRGETLSELNFIDDRRKKVGEFAPADTIVLHPYGRYCNAFKFAGEVDVLEAIEAVKRNYRIDPERISVRGFSMGGAACWQFAVHYPDRWFAANPGAGFSETPRFLKVFQQEDLKPTPYERSLWHLYDCNDSAVNLAQCPTVAYSGELDNQKQAADVMAEALAKEGIELVHLIGPKTKHSYHPETKREVEGRITQLAEVGRRQFGAEVHFETYTLKYNQCGWVTIDCLGEHWKKARVDASLVAGKSVEIKTENISAMTLEFPPGRAPFGPLSPVKLVVDGRLLSVGPPASDRSWKAVLHREDSEWRIGEAPETLAKRHDLQGPIDDAFMDSFVFVRPTGKSSRPKLQAWVEAEMAHAIEHWRRQFRGEARVKDDTQVSDADIASSNLVLWGDVESNAILKSVADKLPIGWDSGRVKVGEKEFAADHHALVLVSPNPLNPRKYVVLNSGFTYREYDYLNNARQVPKLPDWAVIDVDTPASPKAPGKVVAADFFGEDWRLKPGGIR